MHSHCLLLLSWDDQELDGHKDHHDSCHDMLTGGLHAGYKLPRISKLLHSFCQGGEWFNKGSELEIFVHFPIGSPHLAFGGH